MHIFFRPSALCDFGNGLSCHTSPTPWAVLSPARQKGVVSAFLLLWRQAADIGTAGRRRNAEAGWQRSLRSWASGRLRDVSGATQDGAQKCIQQRSRCLRPAHACTHTHTATHLGRRTEPSLCNFVPQAIVQVPRYFRHRKVDIDTKRSSKHWAHDEFNLCSVGDMVRIEPFRALSKRKAHVVVEILKKEDGSPPPNPFPTF